MGFRKSTVEELVNIARIGAREDGGLVSGG